MAAAGGGILERCVEGEESRRELGSFLETVRHEFEADPTGLELEVRWGTINLQTGAFQPGISTEQYRDVARCLQAYGGWKACPAAVERSCYYYRRAGDGKQVRVTSQAGGEQEPGLRVERVVKERLASILLTPAQTRSSHHGLDLKLALNREVPVDAASEPLVVNPDLVRIQQRNTYGLEHWRYDLSITSQGDTKAEAEAAQRSAGSVVLELECECTDLAYLLTTRRSLDFALASCMGKVLFIHRIIDNVPLRMRVVSPGPSRRR